MIRNRMLMAVVALALLIAAPTMMMAAGSVKTSTGSAKFSVVQKMLVSGSEIKAGVYDVKWESNSPEATVMFLNANNGTLVLKVQAKIEELEKNFDFNSLVIGKDSAGRDAIKGLQFAGKKIRIVFE
jgi:hypothetical protein